jgi:hypothetical protein
MLVPREPVAKKADGVEVERERERERRRRQALAGGGEGGWGEAPAVMRSYGMAVALGHGGTASLVQSRIWVGFGLG